MNKSFLKIFIVSLGIIFFPLVVSAAPIPLNIPIGDTKSVDDLGEYIRIFYEFFVTSAGILAAAMMVIAGYKWITAAGNTSIISGAKEQIMSAVFGLVLALTSYMILNFINPNIVSLQPLVIPVVDDLTIGGEATRKCDFDTELTKKTDGDIVPVSCGTTKVVNAAEQDTCIGVWNNDADDICQVVGTNTTPAMFTAEEVKTVKIMNHGAITSQQDFETSTSTGVISMECGKVFWKFADKAWNVGTSCPKVPITGGDQQGERCVINGKFGDFTVDEAICSYVTNDGDFYTHKDGTQLTASQIKAGCGRLNNMECAF
ncbi:MAG: pilin [Patescibacteria group bacterium]|jgi:hypothetical protein